MADKPSGTEEEDITRAGSDVEWRSDEAPTGPAAGDDDDDAPRAGSDVEWRSAEQKKEEDTDAEDDPPRG